MTIIPNFDRYRVSIELRRSVLRLSTRETECEFVKKCENIEMVEFTLQGLSEYLNAFLYVIIT